MATETLTARALEIHDPEGRLLLQYDPATGRAVLHLPGAEVNIESKEGRVVLSSEQDLVLESSRKVRIHGRRGVSIEGDRSALDLGRRASFRAPALDSKIGEVRHEGERVEAKATEAVFSWGRLKQVVDRCLQFARESYLRIESVFDTRAGRIRTEAEQAYDVRADQARLIARGDVRIDGKTINMG